MMTDEKKYIAEKQKYMQFFQLGNKLQTKPGLFLLTLPYFTGGGGRGLGNFLNNSITSQDIKMKFFKVNLMDLFSMSSCIATR